MRAPGRGVYTPGRRTATEAASRPRLTTTITSRSFVAVAVAVNDHVTVDVDVDDHVDVYAPIAFLNSAAIPSA
jgi:hypothetical protein